MTATQPGLETDVASQFEPALCEGEVLLAYPRGRHAQFHAQPARVSVVLPVYNGELRLLRCLESIAAQTFSDYQAIVVDNCSTDGSLAIACRFAAEHPRFIVYQNPKNLGRVGNWNRGLALAIGEYIKPLMVNDFLLPACLAELSGVLDSHPNVVLARCSLTALDQGVQHFIPLFDTSRCLSNRAAIEYGVTTHNPAAGPSAQMFRRAPVAGQRLRFDTGFEWAADYEFALRLFEWGDLYYLRKSLFVFENNIRFATRTKPWQELRDWIEVIASAAFRCRDLLGAEILSRARTKADSIYREYIGRCSSPEDRLRCDSAWEDARSRHRGFFSPQIVPAPDGPGAIPAPASEIASQTPEEFRAVCDYFVDATPPPLTRAELGRARMLPTREQLLPLMPVGGVCAEIGTHDGYFAKGILSVMKPSRLHLFDRDFSALDRAHFQAALEEGIVELHPGEPSALLAKLPEQSLDFIYVGGDHGYEGFARNLKQASLRIRDDGWIVCNSYTFYSPLEKIKYGVARAVNELCLQGGFEILFLALHPLGYHDVALRKRDVNQYP